MNITQQARTLVIEFIQAIWNRQDFHQIDEFFHLNYQDHSLPAHFPAGSKGTLQWITILGESFDHRTVIEETIAEGDKVVLKVSMQLKQLGKWRDIVPTGAEVTTVGYRLFQVKDGKIFAHWALIDGESVENKLKEQVKGCSLPA